MILSGKKIIFILGNFDLGGAERQALLLAQHLREREGASVEVWGFGRGGRVKEICSRLGIPTIAVSINFGPGLAGMLTGVARFILHISKADPDVLMPYTWFPNVLCGLIWRCTPADLCIWNQRDAGLSLENSRLLHQLAARLTPVFISNSTHAADFLEEKFSVSRRWIAVIRNGIALPSAPDDREEWRRRLNLREEEDFVGCMVANLTPNKDHGTAIRAWRSVVDRINGTGAGRRAILILAGRNDGTESSLRELVDRLELHDAVRFLGAVDDVPGLFSACDIAIHCSPSEGCPNAVLEAMASGRVVVATDNAGVREILGEAGTSFIVRNADPEELGRLVIRFATDPASRLEVGQRNQQRVADLFSLERMCQDTVSLLKNRLKSPSHTWNDR